MDKPSESTTRSLQQSVMRLVWSKLLAFIIDIPFILSCIVVLTKYIRMHYLRKTSRVTKDSLPAEEPIPANWKNSS